MLKKKIKKRRVSKSEYFINITVTLVLVLFTFALLFVPRITLNAPLKEIVNINSSYADKGITISNMFGSKRIVKPLDKINTNKNRDYNINYTYKDNIFTYHISKEISVKDIEKPKIKLNGNLKEYYCPNGEYKEQGFSAYDNVDKDITDKVKVKKEKDKIIYIVFDSSGNKNEVVRKLIAKDVDSPSITLNGDDNIFLNLNEPYIEDNVTISDNCDSDLTSNIKITNDIDNTKVGDYRVTYEVSDSSNNKSKIVRNVKVREPLKTNTIYLTFDDGPRDGTTDVILDILKEKGVKATFFVTMNGNDSLIKRIVDEGHSIGIHTASHKYDIIYASKDNYFNDLEQVHKRIYDITGVDSKLIRFPGGSSNTISKKYSEGIMSTLTKEVLNKDYQYYDWNVDSGDASFATNPHKLYNSVVNSISHDKYNVILMHDTKTYTRDALSNIIDYCLSNGYSFDSLDIDTMPIRQKLNN